MNDRIDAIITVTTKNGIMLNKNFNRAYLSAHSFYEAPRELAERIVEDMKDLCFKGVNCGFDSQIKTALNGLSALVVTLTEVRAGDLKSLNKAEIQRKRILDGIREGAYPVKNDMREPVLEYIASSAEAVDAVISLNSEGEIFSTIDERQIRLMEESKTKLAAISKVLADVLDTGSEKAKAQAEKILGLIKAWRQDCTRFMCTSVSLKNLDKALEAAEEWTKQVAAVGKKERAKDLPVCEADEMSVIAQSRGTLEILSTFNMRINSELAEIGIKEDELKAIREKCSDLNTELATLEKKKKEIAAEYKNTGDAAKANREFAAVLKRADEIKAEIKRTDGGRIARRAKEIEVRRKIVESVKFVCDALKDNQNDIIFLSNAIKNVDFNALVGFMTGRSSDMEAALDSITKVRLRVERKFTRNMQALDELDLEEQSTNSLFEGLELEEEEPIKVNAEGLSAEFAAFLDETEDEVKTEEPAVEEKTETDRKIVPLGDDDK